MIRAFMRSRCSLFLLLTAFSPLALRADVIFDNITDTNTDAGLAVIGVSEPSYFNVVSASQAESFTPTADYSMTAAGVYVAAYVPGDFNFDLSLYSNSGGLPGSLIETLGTDLGSFDSATVTADSFAPITLTADTTYWLVVTPYDSDSALLWLAGGNPSAPAATGTPTATNWISNGHQTAQFEIEGTLNTPPVTTPEPSSLYLSGATLLAFLCSRRARKAISARRS